MTIRLALTPQGPFALDDAARFLRGFLPAAGGASDAHDEAASLSLAFRLDGSFVPAAATLRQDGDTVRIAIAGADGQRDAAVAQVARILSLDVDARPWAALARGDAGLAGLQAAFPGSRPVGFASPYEAAVWGILAARVPMKTAAALKRRLAQAHGDRVAPPDVDDEPRDIVDGPAPLELIPSPRQLLEVARFPGVPDEKLVRLHGIARAALDGALDVARLRALPVEHALAELAQLRGVGPWTAAHILYRGCALPDALPLEEPRVLRGVALAYGLDSTPTVEDFTRIAEAWRPFRMWASILAVRLLAGTPGWHGPEPRGRPRPSARRRRAP